MDIETLKASLAPLEGWCDPEKALDLAQAVLAEDALTVVEIGVFGGKSMMAIAMALTEKGSGTVFGIDPWEKIPCLDDETETNKDWWASVDLENIYNKAQSALSRYAFRAKLIRKTSVQAFKAWGNLPIDILHIDGNHAVWSSCTDVVLWLPLVRPGGLVFLDDYDWKSLQPATTLLERKCTLLRTADHAQTHYAVYRKN